MADKTKIQEQREATWNGVIPSDGQGYDVGPKYVSGKVGAQDTTIPTYAEDRAPTSGMLRDPSKAGITVPVRDQFNPRERKIRDISGNIIS